MQFLHHGIVEPFSATRSNPPTYIAASCMLLTQTLLINTFLSLFALMRCYEDMSALWAGFRVCLTHSVGFYRKYGHFGLTFHDKIDESFLKFLSLTWVLLDFYSATRGLVGENE